MMESKEIAELKASNEKLRLACQLAIDMISINDINLPNTVETLQDAIDTTGERCLADVKAEAGRAGFIAGRSRGVDYFKLTETQAADRYASKIRKGESK
jgi:hypothetical protein